MTIGEPLGDESFSRQTWVARFSLEPWDGDVHSLEGVDVLLDEVLHTPAK